MSDKIKRQTFVTALNEKILIFLNVEGTNIAKIHRMSTFISIEGRNFPPTVNKFLKICYLVFSAHRWPFVCTITYQALTAYFEIDSVLNANTDRRPIKNRNIRKSFAICNLVSFSLNEKFQCMDRDIG